MTAACVFPNLVTDKGKELILVPLDLSFRDLPDYYLIHAEKKHALLIAIASTLEEASEQIDYLDHGKTSGAFLLYHLIATRDGSPMEVMVDIPANRRLPIDNLWDVIILRGLGSGRAKEAVFRSASKLEAEKEQVFL